MTPGLCRLWDIRWRDAIGVPELMVNAMTVASVAPLDPIECAGALRVEQLPWLLKGFERANGGCHAAARRVVDILLGQGLQQYRRRVLQPGIAGPLIGTPTPQKYALPLEEMRERAVIQRAAHTSDVRMLAGYFQVPKQLFPEQRDRAIFDCRVTNGELQSPPAFALPSMGDIISLVGYF